MHVSGIAVPLSHLKGIRAGTGAAFLARVPDNPYSELPEVERICEFCVGIVAAYRDTSSYEDDAVFYTAKVLPVGYPGTPPTFLNLIWYKHLPVGVGDVTLGPTLMARTV